MRRLALVAALAAGLPRWAPAGAGAASPRRELGGNATAAPTTATEPAAPRRALLSNATATPTFSPTTALPSRAPTTARPSYAPTTPRPTRAPTFSPAPTTLRPSTAPTTPMPSLAPSTAAPSTLSPTTSTPSYAPTTGRPSAQPSTAQPSTSQPSTGRPTPGPSLTLHPTLTLKPTQTPTETPLVIACAGDSITKGGHDGINGTSYPELLQGLLGPGYRVLNFGRSGSSLGPEKPWRDGDEYEDMLNTQYDLAILTLGANDAKTDGCDACWGAAWDQHKEQWSVEYVDLINDLREANPTAKFFLGLNTPYLGGSGKWGDEAEVVINDVLPGMSADVASVVGARGTVDFRSRFLSFDGSFNATLYHDKIHPNDAGYARMAGAAYDALMSPDYLDVPAPSRVPTYAPTYAPSPGPTGSPAPSSWPSSVPSLAPTTARPSPAPSLTFAPTLAPTLSSKPTAAPSPRPTAGPTTARPSYAPSTARPSTARPTTAAPTTLKPTLGGAGVVSGDMTLAGLSLADAARHEAVFVAAVAALGGVPSETVAVAIAESARRRLADGLTVHYTIATASVAAAQAIARDLAIYTPADVDAALRAAAGAAGAAEAFAAAETTALSAPEAAAAPDAERSRDDDAVIDAAGAAVLGPVVAGAALLAVAGFLFLRRRRKLSKTSAPDALDVEEPRAASPPPPPPPPRTPGSGSPAGLILIDGFAKTPPAPRVLIASPPPRLPPPEPELAPPSPIAAAPSVWERGVAAIRNLRANSQDDEDTPPPPAEEHFVDVVVDTSPEPSPEKAEATAPAPTPYNSPVDSQAPHVAASPGVGAGARQRLREVLSGWRSPRPFRDATSFDEELRQFDDDFTEGAVDDMFQEHLADTPRVARPAPEVVDVPAAAGRPDDEAGGPLE